MGFLVDGAVGEEPEVDVELVVLIAPEAVAGAGVAPGVLVVPVEVVAGALVVLVEVASEFAVVVAAAEMMVDGFVAVVTRVEVVAGGLVVLVEVVAGGLVVLVDVVASGLVMPDDGVEVVELGPMLEDPIRNAMISTMIAAKPTRIVIAKTRKAGSCLACGVGWRSPVGATTT